MSRENDLRDILDMTAKAFADYDDNPTTWQTWIVYLLAQLQQQAMDTNPLHQELYEDMLEVLRSNIRNRLKTGGW